MNIFGQDKLVTELDKIFSIFEGSQGSIKPHFILTGGSGSGKTFTISNLAAKYKIHFIEINADTLIRNIKLLCIRCILPITLFRVSF